jgi:hypothetical protein
MKSRFSEENGLGSGNEETTLKYLGAAVKYIERRGPRRGHHGRRTREDELGFDTGRHTR